jgi:hypothetical protein
MEVAKLGSLLKKAIPMFLKMLSFNNEILLNNNTS